MSILPRKPQMKTESVEALVERVRRGFIRIPNFQRGLNWDSSDAVLLFDSIYQGYPIGSLFFYKQPANAERVNFGPLAFSAPEVPDAWWVIDGQQRLTCLTVCLLRSTPLPTKPDPDDPFVLYFDCEKQTFQTPSQTGLIPSSWIPLPELLDTSRISERIDEWKHRDSEDLRRLVFETGARIRDFSIQIHLIDSCEGERIAREVFYRINSAGKPLNKEEVYEALFRNRPAAPATLENLAEELTSVGMGRFKEHQLRSCLQALGGSIDTDTLPTFRRCLSFLRRDVGIPHLQLLPNAVLLEVLTKFFHLHPDPLPRTRKLLARWFWRIVFGAGTVEREILRNQGIQALTNDEEESVQSLLGMVLKERPQPLDLPKISDSSDAGRIFLLALAHLEPKRLEDGAVIDLVEFFETEGQASSAIFSSARSETAQSLANRLIQSQGTNVHRLLRERIAEYGFEDPVLKSHAIDLRAAELLAAGQLDEFLEHRADLLIQEANRLGERTAEWDHNDRPSIEHILAEAGVEYESSS